jgi:hypothetical protein
VVLLSLQAYMSVITLTALVLAAAAADRRRAEQGRLSEAQGRVRAHEALEESEQRANDPNRILQMFPLCFAPISSTPW